MNQKHIYLCESQNLLHPRRQERLIAQQLFSCHSDTGYSSYTTQQHRAGLSHSCMSVQQCKAGKQKRLVKVTVKCAEWQMFIQFVVNCSFVFRSKHPFKHASINENFERLPVKFYLTVRVLKGWNMDTSVRLPLKYNPHVFSFCEQSAVTSLRGCLCCC